MAGIADFIFLIDGTGSMKPCMDALKNNISFFFEALSSAQSPVTDWRGKVVTFRDQKVDGGKWFEDNDFVSSEEELKAQLNKLEPVGGGDEPESALDAIHKIATMDITPEGSQESSPNTWRAKSLRAARILIIFTDASPHPVMTYEGGAGGNVHDVINACHTNRIIPFIYAPDIETWEDFAATDKAEWESLDGPDFQQSMKKMVENEVNFAKVLEALAKSVSKSAAAVAL